MFGFLAKFFKFRAIRKDEHARSAPREWLFVNAYGSQQARSGEPQTYGEALDFLKNHIGCSFVRSDRERGIIFFDGRKLGG